MHGAAPPRAILRPLRQLHHEGLPLPTAAPPHSRRRPSRPCRALPAARRPRVRPRRARPPPPPRPGPFKAPSGLVTRPRVPSAPPAPPAATRSPPPIAPSPAAAAAGPAPALPPPPLHTSSRGASANRHPPIGGGTKRWANRRWCGGDAPASVAVRTGRRRDQSESEKRGLDPELCPADQSERRNRHNGTAFRADE